ncbi:MAG TPA: RagB/SusD family nutrient uptake outer membrane protein [Prevotella sp.]|nr:RagB/SusD family nutrient uptake outer membrane protein [Prevotella sp.]
MKKYLFNIFLVVFALMSLTSCSDYLDKEVDLTLSDEEIFSNYDNTNGFLANIYTYLPDAFHGYTDGQYLAASRDCMTDNATSFWSVHRYNTIQSDGYDATNHYFAEQYWENDLKGIRASNQFLEKARVSVVGNSAKSNDDNHLYNRWMAEARFLRAMLHFDLASWFGAIPIEDHVLTNAEASTMTRTPAADAYKWIADECDSIINSGALPFRYSDENSNWGHINGAAVYALKSRALLYRASPLNNTSNNGDWWTEAAQAALDFISVNAKSSNPYKLYTTASNDPSQNYYQCFVSTPHLNNEFILSRSEWSTYDIELFLSPCGYSGNVNSVGRTNPTENLVASYETINGLPIDKDPTYNAQKPYENRDPRLNQTIFHHGMYWGDSNNDEYRMIDVSEPDGSDYQELHGGTTTGYYEKKFCNNMSFKNPTTYTHACPIFRYAEILLNAAEALNECGRTSEAYTYVNQVRARVGMPGYSNMTQPQFRERIHNERRVELAFEDHRFFDVRRWKLFTDNVSAAAEKSKPIYDQVYNLYSTHVTINDGKTVYTIKNNSVHPQLGIVLPKSYLFPIPNEEYKKDNALGQNSGWELSPSAASSVK